MAAWIVLLLPPIRWIIEDMPARLISDVDVVVVGGVCWEGGEETACWGEVAAAAALL